MAFAGYNNERVIIESICYKQIFHMYTNTEFLDTAYTVVDNY